MQRANLKSSDLIQRSHKKDLLGQGLQELVRSLHSLRHRVLTQIDTVTRAEADAIDDIGLFRECDLCLKEFHYLAEAAAKIVSPIQQRIENFYKKTRFVKQDPFYAHSWSPVQLLHLLNEQAMGKRQQEIQEIEKKKKDMIKQLEVEVSACCQGFEEVVRPLNLLCYMRDCLQNDHALPASLMYHTDIKETVRSPFVKTKVDVAQEMQSQVKKPVTQEAAKELLKKLRDLEMAEKNLKQGNKNI